MPRILGLALLAVIAVAMISLVVIAFGTADTGPTE
jgi:hypothetical protein